MFFSVFQLHDEHAISARVIWIVFVLQRWLAWRLYASFSAKRNVASFTEMVRMHICKRWLMIFKMKFFCFFFSSLCTGTGITRGCDLNHGTLCQNEAHCHFCSTQGCNAQVFNANNVPVAPGSASMYGTTITLIVAGVAFVCAYA